jgi:membrane protein required for colicin V production
VAAMNWLDAVIVVLLAVPVFFGVKAGIIKALFMVAGIILGVVLAGRLSGPLGNILPISNKDVADAIAFAVILIVVLIIAVVLALVVKWAVSAIMLGWVNNIGGGLLGLFLGFFFCGALLTMWVKYLGDTGVVQGSFLARFLLDIFPIALGLLPSEFHSVRTFFK